MNRFPHNNNFSSLSFLNRERRIVTKHKTFSPEEKRGWKRKKREKHWNRLNAEHANNGVTLPRSNDRESRVWIFIWIHSNLIQRSIRIVRTSIFSFFFSSNFFEKISLMMKNIRCEGLKCVLRLFKVNVNNKFVIVQLIIDVINSTNLFRD